MEPNYYRGELSSFDDRLPPLYVELGYTPSGKVRVRHDYLCMHTKQFYIGQLTKVSTSVQLSLKHTYSHTHPHQTNDNRVTPSTP